MLQIKTIKETDPNSFDLKVNEALAEGWTLVRRCLVPEGFIAEMEKEVITENERTCENCKHFELENYEEPCAHCNGECWEAKE